jgi:hypothetical protein
MADRKRLVPLKQLAPLRSGSGQLKLPPAMARLRSQTPDVAAVSRGGMEVFAESGDTQPCQLSKGKAGLRPCHVELLFVGAVQSQRRGVDPGMYLRFCTERSGAGRLVRVKDHSDALAKSNRYCACATGGDADRRASCATDMGAKTALDVKAPRSRKPAKPRKPRARRR